MMIVLLAFATSLPTAWAWAKYIQAVHEKKALQAAMWDVVIIAAGQIALLQLWAQSGNDIVVLVAGMIGGAMGTYLTVKRS